MPNKRQRREVIEAALGNDGPSGVSESSEDIFQHEMTHLEDDDDECLNVETPCESFPKFRDVGTQTESVFEVSSCDATMQFPQDVSETVWLEHMYSARTEETKKQEELSDIPGGISEDEDEELYDSQVELFSGSEEEIEATNTSEDMHLGQEAAMEVIISQPSSQSTESGHSEYQISENDTDHCSQSTNDSKESVKPSLDKQRVFVVYEEQLKELLRFCSKCGSLITM